jgi:hypothetical protein
MDRLKPLRIGVLCSRAHPGRIGVPACALAARADRYCFVVLICGVYRRGRLYAQERSVQAGMRTRPACAKGFHLRQGYGGQDGEASGSATLPPGERIVCPPVTVPLSRTNKLLPTLAL